MTLIVVKFFTLVFTLSSAATANSNISKPLLSCESFKMLESNIVGPPKIRISSAPGNLRLDEDNSTYVVETLGIEIRVDCWAPYPINVDFKGHLSNRDPTVGVIERSAKDYLDPSTYCYSINFTLTSLEQITGEYSCFSVKNHTLRSSTYIYHAAHPQETLLNRGQSIFVEMKRDEDWLDFPCATSNPHVPVNLFKREGSESVQLQVDGINLKYDPKIGFRLWKTLINPSVSVSLFQCKTDLSPKDKVDIAVLPLRETIATPADPELILKEGDILKVSCESPHEIIIDNTNDRVDGRVLTRPNPTPTLEEPNPKPYFLTYQTGILEAGESGIISCRTKENNTLIHEWTFNVLAVPVRGNKIDGNFKPRVPALRGLNPYKCKILGRPTQVALHACSNWVECNLRKCNVQDRTCESHECQNSKTSACVPSGIFQCFNSFNQSIQTQIYFSGLHNRNTTYTSWGDAPKEDILKIRKLRLEKQPHIKRGENDTLENVEVVCEGSSFVFAVGFKWFLLLGNDGTLLPIPDELIQHKWRRLNSKHVIKSIARINIPRNTQQIVCKAPVWNSTEWKEDGISVQNLFEDFKTVQTQNATNTTLTSLNSAFRWELSTLSSYISIFLVILSMLC